MRTLLIAIAASALLFSSAACEKTVNEARSPRSRQQLRQTSSARTPAASRTPTRSRTLTPVQARQARSSTADRRQASSALRPPSFSRSSVATATPAGRQRSQWNPAQALKPKAKSDAGSELIDVGKKILSKAWMFLL